MTQSREKFLEWLNNSQWTGASYEAGALAWTAWQAALEQADKERQGTTLAVVKRAHVEAVLRLYPTHAEAAEALGIDSATLYRWRKRWGMVGNTAVPEPATAAHC